MLELRKYPKAELSALFGTRDTEALKRKLERYGIVYEEAGWGNTMTFDIKEITDPFKIFCITELDFDGRTDFKKVRNFYYYFFNDEEFMAMPDEVKEVRMRAEGRPVARQTIANYTYKLQSHNLIERNTKDFIYYFAFKQTQRMTDRAEYLQAWHEYWADIGNGFSSFDAICNMRVKYGGVARKQAIPEINGIYNEKIEYLCSLIQASFENEMGE